MPPKRQYIQSNEDYADLQATKIKRKRANFHLELPKRRETIGQVLVCGTGDTGQLGLGEDILERKRLTVVEKVPLAVDICAGGMHCLALTSDGDIYSFGCNDEGALGRDSSEDGSESLPSKIDLPGKALCISAGDSHSACLLEDGRVFAWGSFRDSHGNMGLTMDGNKRRPINILEGTVCVAIASGSDHLVMLTTAGKVFTIGCAEQGQLGRISERSISGEGRHGKRHLLTTEELIMLRAKPIEAIWATNYCTFARETQTNSIWAVGLNNYKQLTYKKDTERILKPIKTSLENVKHIDGGQHHTLILKTDNNCYTIGRPEYGRLGLGNMKDVVIEPTLVKKLAGKKIEAIACGEACSYAVTKDGQLYTWGMGSNNQLGVGDGDDEWEPALVTSKNTQNKKVLLASGGGQHSIVLVEADQNEIEKENIVASPKDKKAPKEQKEPKVKKETKQQKEPKEQKELKEQKESKEQKDSKESKKQQTVEKESADSSEKQDTNGPVSETTEDTNETTANAETKPTTKRSRKKK